jgi:hypothetical protein
MPSHSWASFAMQVTTALQDTGLDDQEDDQDGAVNGADDILPDQKVVAKFLVRSMGGQGPECRACERAAVCASMARRVLAARSTCCSTLAWCCADQQRRRRQRHRQRRQQHIR